MDLADRLLQGVEASARRHALSLLACRAILEESRDDLDRALETFRGAADGWQEFGFLLEEGEARLGAGRILVRLRRPGGSDMLREARAIFVRLGAAPRVADTDRWLDLAA
jgi:hypothetical protein